MKKVLVLLILTLTFMLGINKVNALDLEQVSLSVNDKSDTITVVDDGIGVLEVNPKIEFNLVGDFITYKLVLKNNDGKKFKVVSVEDNNTNENLSVEYDYNTELNTDNNEILITLKYTKKLEDPNTTLNSIKVTIKLVDEDDESQDITVINDTDVQGRTEDLPKIPKTGDNIQNSIWLLLISLIGLILSAIYLIKNKGKKYSKGLLSILLLLTLVPTIVFAATNKEVIFNINFTESNIKINIKHTVEFDSKGGTEVEAQIINNNDKATEPTDPTKDHYDFVKWIDEDNNEYDFDTEVTRDIKLSAVWEKKSYTVTYNSDGGSPVASEIKKYQQKFTKPSNPTKDHYDFVKWVDEQGNEYDFDTEVSKDIELKATWEKKSYTITFDSNGGTTVDAQTVKYQDKVTKPTNPRKDHYNFVKWVDEQDNEYDFDSEVSKDIELKALWEKETYTITFDTNGGSAVTPQTVKYQDKVTKPTNPTKDHYSFVKWVDENNNEYDFDSEVTGNKDLYAKWTPKEYTITYNLNGGSAPNPTTYTIESDTFTLNNPTKDNHAFKGWTGSNGNAPETTVTIEKGTTGNLTYTAVFNPIYTVTYDVNGGTTVTPASKQIENGEEIGTLPTTTREHYDFDGWYVGNTKIDEEYVVEDNITVTAKWEKKSYTVTFDSNGGRPVTQQTVKYQDKVTKPTNPTKDHYSFVKWVDEQDNEYDFDSEVTGNKDLYAKWTPKEYTITYNLNGGSVSTPNKNTYTIETETFTLINPEKAFFKFKGWTGTNYDEMEETIVIPKGSTGDRIYDANWEGATLVEHVQGLFEKGDSTLTDDNIDGSLRYIGRNINNFVKFNNEPWVMYGVFDVDDGTGLVEKRVKLERHGEASYSAWSLRDPAVNNNNGINQWGESGDYPGSSIMRLLNTEFLDYTKTGTVTWLDGSVYYYRNSLSKEAQDMIKDALWYTGAGNVADGIIYPQNSPMLTPEFVIQAEKSNYSGKMCSEGNMCNDDVVRTTRWVGKVGLPYASDFMYKTSGGSLGRDVCLKTATIYNWGPNYNECFQNTWNRWAFYIYTMTPFADQSSASKIIGYTPTSFRLYSVSASAVDRALPNVYLKPEVKVIAGEGTSRNPYILELE